MAYLISIHIILPTESMMTMPNFESSNLIASLSLSFCFVVSTHFASWLLQIVVWHDSHTNLSSANTELPLMFSGNVIVFLHKKHEAILAIFFRKCNFLLFYFALFRFLNVFWENCQFSFCYCDRSDFVCQWMTRIDGVDIGLEQIRSLIRFCCYSCDSSLHRGM